MIITFYIVVLSLLSVAQTERVLNTKIGTSIQRILQRDDILISNYSSALTTNSATYTRLGNTGTFYFETIQITVSISGNYTFISDSTIDTYGYLYVNNINASNLTANLLTYNDDSAGNSQFLITYLLETRNTYIIVLTTYSQNVRGSFSLIVSGPARASLRRINLTLTSQYTSTMRATTGTTSRLRTTTSTTNSVNNITTSYSSALTNSSATYSRFPTSGTFYYETIEVVVVTSGYYTFKSNSTIDAYGYLYENSINASDLSINLLTYNDDSAGTVQFQMTYFLEARKTYIVVFTTYMERVTSSFSITVSGLAGVTLQRVNLVLTPPYTSIMTTTTSQLRTTTSTTSSVNNITTSYSSALTNSSATYSRFPISGTFYYETIQVVVLTSGYYTFKSNSTIDAYGYLYENSINASDLSINLLIHNDDSGGNAQFQMTYFLEARKTYIVVFTTYLERVTTSFSITVSGPAGVSLERVNLVLTPPYTSTTTTTAGIISRRNTTTSMTNILYSITTNYSSALTENSPTYSRIRSSGTFYYETIQVVVVTSGYYIFKSNSTIDAYGCLYENSINASDLTINLLICDDDSGGNTQFQMRYLLEANSTYIVVFTTYLERVTTSFSITVSGPARVTLQRVNLILTPPYASTMTATTGTTSQTITPMSAANYSSALTNNSPIYSRFPISGTFYYETIQVVVSTPGYYTFKSNSAIDAYGYLYENNINASDLSINLLTHDDDSGGNTQFQMRHLLEASNTYIVVFTTYAQSVTGAFSLTVSGPAQVRLRSINLTLTSSAIASMPTRLSTAVTMSPSVPAPLCITANNRAVCPSPVATVGRIVVVDPINRTLTNGFIAPNNTFFNLNDSSSVNGYIRTVTVQYTETRLPTASARIWIYGIVPILGSYFGCSQYLVPSSQISTSLSTQTYMIPSNTINVFNGTYIGVGIEDTSASIATTYGGSALRTTGANLSSSISTRGPLYFFPDQPQRGVKISYTIVI